MRHDEGLVPDELFPYHQDVYSTVVLRADRFV